MSKKILILFLTFAMLIVSSGVLAADVNQVATETPAADNSQKPVYQDPTLAVKSSAGVMQDTSQQQLLQTINGLSSYYANYLKNQGVDWVANTDFSLSFNNLTLWNNPNIQLTTLQPFRGKFSFDDANLPFWQLSAGYVNNNFTGNIGVGYRAISESKAQMFGVNLFYDAAWFNNTFSAPSGYTSYSAADAAPVHQRVGVGLEYFLYMLEARVNGYYGVSSGQLLGTAWTTSGTSMTQYSFYEKAANGFDASLSAQVPFIPWLKANVAGYKYFADAGQTAYNGSLNGLYVGGTIQLTPQLAIDGGYDNGGGSGFVKATYNILALPQPSLLWSDETINDYSQYNVSNKFIDKVKRNNNITTVTYQQQTRSGATGGVATVVVTDYNGVPQVNVPVMLANSNYTVTSLRATNSSGQAVFTGLPTPDNPNPVDLNAAFVKAGATGAQAAGAVGDGATADSYNYNIVTFLRKVVAVAGGNNTLQNVQVMNQAVFTAGTTIAPITVAYEPQYYNQQDVPVNPPLPAPPAAETVVTVNVWRSVNGTAPVPYNGFAHDNTGGASSVQIGVFNTTGTSGSATQVDPSMITMTAAGESSFIFKMNLANSQTFNYGSGQYAASVKINDGGVHNNQYVGATQALSIGQANQAINIIVYESETYPTLGTTTCTFTKNSANVNAGEAANMYYTGPKNARTGGPYPIYIAAASSVDPANPLISGQYMQINTSGVATFNSIPLVSNTLAILAFYDTGTGGSHDYKILGYDTKVIPAAYAGEAITSSIAEIPIIINN